MALSGFEFVGVEHAGCFRVNCLQAFPVLAKRIRVLTISRDRWLLPTSVLWHDGDVQLR